MRGSRLCTALFLLASACLAAGQQPAGPEVSQEARPYGLAIPASHPRLWWNAERLTRAPAAYRRLGASPREDDPLGLATRGVLRNDAGACRAAVAYAMEKLCTNAACNSTDPNYGVAADDARWEGENVILVYDWCHAHFTPAQRATLVTRWNTYFENIRRRAWGGPAMVQSNYNWGYLRNEIEWGIATWGENPEADRNLRHGLVTRWEERLVPYFARAGQGGVLQEGSAYGSAIGDYSTVPFGTAFLLGRDLYRETNFFREAVAYMIHATLPAPTTNRNNGETHYELFPFADDERFFDGGMPTRANYGAFMTAMADYWRDVPLGQYARRWLTMVKPEVPAHVAAIDRGGQALDFSALPLDYYAPGPRFLYGRNQWGPQSTVFNLQLGVTDDEGHRHNDVGSWQLWRAGRWLSRETTGYSQDFVGYGGRPVDANDAAAHNTLLVGGRGPAPHRQSGPTRVTRLESRPDYTYAAVDLSPSYRSETPQLDNPAAAHVEREFLFIRAIETLIVFDRIETARADAGATFLARFERAPKVDGTARTVTAVNGNQAVRLTTLLPTSPVYRPIVNEGPPVGQFRLEVESTGETQTYFLHVLQARRADGPDLTTSLVERESGFAVTLVHPTQGTTEVVFEKGRATTGGSVTIAGQTHRLTSTVAGIRVDDRGVTWTDGPAEARLQHGVAGSLGRARH